MDTIQIYEDNRAVAAAFAAHLVKLFEATEKTRMAVSGGSTPKVLFEILAKEYADTIDWSGVYIYWVDERCVPPYDEQSNYRMTREKLLDHIPIPMTNVFRIEGERQPEEEAKRYAQLVSETVPNDGGIPAFDLVLLGMGSDGHTASIFPHQIELLRSENLYEVGIHPESGQRRVTMTGPVINTAKSIHFLVTGAGKSPVLQKILNSQDNYQSFPAAHVPTAYWWLDKAAFGK